MAALQAGAQVHPLIAHCNALLADMHFGCGVTAVFQVFAVGHGYPQTVAFPDAIKCDAGEKGAPPRWCPFSSAWARIIEPCGQAPRARNKRVSKFQETPE